MCISAEGQGWRVEAKGEVAVKRLENGLDNGALSAAAAVRNNRLSLYPLPAFPFSKSSRLSLARARDPW